MSCLANEGGSPPQAAREIPLRVGTSGDYAPFSVLASPTSEPSGFSADVARAWAEASGQAIEWVPFRWPGLRRDLEAGRFDLALSGITVRPDRSVAGRFSVPLTTSGLVLLVEADHPARDADSLADRPLSVAVNAGGHLERTARRLFPAARIVPVPDNAAVLDQLGQPGVEAVVTDSLEAPHWQARRPGLRAIGPLTRDRKAAWFPIGGADAARRFDRWLVDAERSGTLDELRARHGLPTDRTAAPAAALVSSLDERLSLMVGVARTKHALGRPIEDVGRETRVLDAAVAAIAREAAARGHAPPAEADVRRLYRAQIEAAKWIQHAWTGPASAEAPGDPEAARVELETSLRPSLLFLGDRIAWLLVACITNESPAPTREALDMGLARHALPEVHRAALHEALVAILPQRGDGD